MKKRVDWKTVSMTEGRKLGGILQTIAGLKHQLHLINCQLEIAESDIKLIINRLMREEANHD